MSFALVHKREVDQFIKVNVLEISNRAVTFIDYVVRGLWTRNIKSFDVLETALGLIDH